MIECPCKDCLCISICRFKHFSGLVRQCRLAYDFIAVKRTESNASISPINRDPVRMNTLIDVLRPVYWKVGVTRYKDDEYPVIQWTKEGLISYGEKKKRGK